MTKPLSYNPEKHQGAACGNSGVLQWLLEEANPAVRYQTLIELLHLPESAPEVQTARRQIMENPSVSRLLAAQNSEGFWGKPDKFYAKWRGTFWTLILLAELGADGGNPKVHKAGQFLLEHSQVRKTGGFAFAPSTCGMGGRAGAEHPCMTGKMVRSLLRLGFLEDPRVWRSIDWIVKCQRFDDGEATEPPLGWPYEWEVCWGRHTCLRGIVFNLKALSEIPPDRRSDSINRVIREGAEFLLKHHVYRRSHDLSMPIRREWQEFVFPLLGDTDALDMLLVMTQLGYHDLRMENALDLVISKRGEHGQWQLDRSYRCRCQSLIGKEARPNKWVTLRAMTVLIRCGLARI
jgi:hypothetical protein